MFAQHQENMEGYLKKAPYLKRLIARRGWPPVAEDADLVTHLEQLEVEESISLSALCGPNVVHLAIDDTEYPYDVHNNLHGITDIKVVNMFARLRSLRAAWIHPICAPISAKTLATLSSVMPNLRAFAVHLEVRGPKPNPGSYYGGRVGIKV